MKKGKTTSKLMMRAKSAVRSLLRRFDFEICRYSRTTQYTRLHMLDRNNITTVLDIGANVGQYAEELRTTGYSGRIVSFEPLSEVFAELSNRAAYDNLWECKQLALGHTIEEVEIKVAENFAISSLLPMSERHATAAPYSLYIGSEKVSMKTLDSLRSELLGCEERVWLKVDVQGCEKQVLEGAVETLKQVIKVVEVEMSLVTLYEGQCLYNEMLDYLHSAGFALAWLQREFVDPESHILLQVNGIFVRPPT
jgi:FkbM family methyltransferase